jgi:hypothetical protein
VPALSPSLVIALLLASVPALAEEPCDLEVLGSRAKFATRMFQGKPTRRDVVVSVDVRSTSTVTISAVELAIFLGASLEEVTSTRPEALPTRTPRELRSGGLAFRQEVQALVPASARRTLEVKRKALPLDEDLYGVKVVVAGCRRVHAVGDVTVAMPAEGEPPRWLLVSALVLVAAAAVLVLVRLR